MTTDGVDPELAAAVDTVVDQIVPDEHDLQTADAVMGLVHDGEFEGALRAVYGHRDPPALAFAIAYLAELGVPHVATGGGDPRAD